ncbi:MAG: glucosaminidase domain-containing protein [Firmicutes bacterium]|nr:glucosaminidase domain-containing protein [Bacillota bacterium]
MGILGRLKKALLPTIIVNIVAGLMLLIIIITLVNAALAIGVNESQKEAQGILGLPACLTGEIVEESVKSYEKYNVPTALTLAQIILESGTDFSDLARNDHNLFGVKYFGSGTEGIDYNVYETKEWGAEGEITIKAKFVKYDSYAECIDEHGRLLSSPSYIRHVSDINSTDSWADGISEVYATSPEYAENLKSIMKTYNLYRFDGVSLSGLDDILNAVFSGTETESNTLQDVIVSAALSYTDPYNQGYKHLCEAWVAKVYHRAGLHYETSCCASKARERFAITSGKIPVGAIIYSGSGYKSTVTCSCGRNAGHVAIYIGNGQVAGSQVPFIMSINKWISIFGYGGYSFNTNNIK